MDSLLTSNPQLLPVSIGATGVLMMGTLMVLSVGPPLELWNRAIKPHDKRVGATVWRRDRAAWIYVAVCLSWWAFLVWAISAICSQANLWH